MMTNPSLITRIGTGKLAGALLSIGGVLVFARMVPDVTPKFQIAIVLWYVTMGAFVGFFGVYTTYPILKLRLSWWIRGPWLGAWMNLVLVLFIYDQVSVYLTQAFGADSALNSPWWLVAEGAIMGLVLDFLCTKIGGDGGECVSNEQV